jgi:hypothetical protein
MGMFPLPFSYPANVNRPGRPLPTGTWESAPERQGYSSDDTRHRQRHRLDRVMPEGKAYSVIEERILPVPMPEKLCSRARKHSRSPALVSDDDRSALGPPGQEYAETIVVDEPEGTYAASTIDCLF